jgi:hypothetical protein
MVNYGGWDMSVSEILMMQTIQLSHVAWDYADGDKNEKTISKKPIKTMPSLFEFIASAICPSQCLGGPSMHLVDFLDYIYRRNDYEKPVDTVAPALKRVMASLFWITIYLAIINNYPLSLLYDGTYADQPFHLRVSPSFLSINSSFT